MCLDSLSFWSLQHCQGANSSFSTIIAPLDFITDNLHKDAPLSHIRDLRDKAAVTFRWSTPRSLTMPLTEDDEQLISRRPRRVHTSRVSGFEIGVGQYNMQNQKKRKTFLQNK
jgi:hypothetical protein